MERYILGRYTTSSSAYSICESASGRRLQSVNEIGFLQFYAAFAHNERSVANLQRAAEQRRSDLRVENWLGKHAELVVDDFEVL